MLIPEEDLNYMRNNRQWQEFFLAVEQPPVIAVMLVNDATIATAETDIVFDDGDFDETAFVYFTVEVYDGDTGEHKGTTRLRDTEAPAAAGTLNVAANSIAWEDDDRIEIKRQIRPWAVNPNLENTEEDLDNAYTNESTSPYPLAHIGPPACIFLNDTYDISGDHGEARWWSDDECINAGAALASYDWTFLTGHPITPTNVAGTADDPIIVHYYETGQHYLYHTTTDSVGKAHTRHSHTYVFDDPSAPSLTGNYPIREFSIENLSGDLEGGAWRGTVRVWEDADESQFPELSEVVVFSRQHWYDMSADCDVEVDVGYGWEHRENILFVGYIVKDSVRKDPHTGDVTFEIASITEIMKSMTCWGAGFRDSGTADWHVFPTAPNELTLNLAAHHVFREHTTVSFIADVYLKLNDANGNSIRMDSIDFQESDPYDQIRVQIGEAGRAVLCANKFGQIFLEPNLQLQKLAVRATADLSTMSLQHGDWRDEINLGDEPNTKEVCQVDFIGFTEDLTPYYSLAPYRQYSTGRVQKTTGVRVADQTEANVYGGLFEGWYNGEFKNVSVPMRGFWPVFDVIPQRYVGLTLDEDDTNRGLIWDDTRHIVKQISVSVNAEGSYALTDLVLEQESYGLPGLTNVVPPEPTPPVSPNVPPPPIPPPHIGHSKWGMLLLSTSQLARSFNFFDSPTPNWEDISDNLTGSFYNIALGPDNQAYVTTTTGVWYIPDIAATSISWNCIETLAQARIDTGHPTAQFRSVKVGVDGSVYLGWHEWAYNQRGYWTGNAGGINYFAFANYMPGNCSVRCQTSRCTHCIYLDEGTLRIACGAGGCGRSLLWSGGVYTQYPPAAQMAISVCDGYVQCWDGETYSNYDPASFYCDIGDGDVFGLDVCDGVLLHRLVAFGGTRFLYRGLVQVADSNAVFGGVVNGARAIFTHERTDEIVWVRREVSTALSPIVVVWTDDAFVNWHDKTGDFRTEVGEWSGASEPAGGAGNAVPLAFGFEWHEWEYD